MEKIADKTWLIDLEHLGYPQRIGCGVLEGPNGVALVDPGPTATLPELRRGLQTRGLGFGDIEALLLTHIHLDHAGATGTLVRENPGIQVYVHEKGAPHMISPEKLVRSATRLYQENMERFWGEFAEVPEERLRILTGGETIEAAGRRLEVEYTPGHAIHHVSFFDDSTGIAYVGDATGERLMNTEYVMPATPPPDISLDQIEDSLRKIEARKPGRIFLTHFGPSGELGEHLEQYRRRLSEWSRTVRRSVEAGGDESARETAFIENVASELRAAIPAESVGHYLEVGSLRLCWLGLHRYWRKLLEAHKAGRETN